MSRTSVAVTTRAPSARPAKREWWAEPAWPVYVGSFLGALLTLLLLSAVGSRRTRWY